MFADENVFRVLMKAKGRKKSCRLVTEWIELMQNSRGHGSYHFRSRHDMQQLAANQRAEFSHPLHAE